MSESSYTWISRQVCLRAVSYTHLDVYKRQNKIRILRLPAQVKKMIVDNDLSERHARALLRLPNEELQLTVAKTVCEREYNVKKTEELVRLTKMCIRDRR